MSIREAKVSELNRILPMIRKTINEQKNVDELKKQLVEQRNLFNSNQKEIEDLDQILERAYLLGKTVNDDLKNKLHQKEKMQKEFYDVIKNFEDQIKELETQIKFEKSLYSGIANLIAVKSRPAFSEELYGDFKVTDLQEEYIQEYIYLILYCDTCLYVRNFLYARNHKEKKEFEKILNLRYYNDDKRIEAVLKCAIALAKEYKD